MIDVNRDDEPSFRSYMIYKLSVNLQENKVESMEHPIVFKQTHTAYFSSRRVIKLYTTLHDVEKLNQSSCGQGKPTSVRIRFSHKCGSF